MDKQFWAGKRVYLTGHTGFKGGWLALWLTSLGATVKGYSLKAPTTPSLFDVANIHDIVESEIGDIRAADALQASMRSFQPDIVFHLAAQPLVRLSYKEPVDTFSANVMGTVNVLECIRKTPSVRSVVVVTSDKCYDNKERLRGYREGEALGGYDAYSASKACAELVTNAYRQSFFQANGDASDCFIASARAGNVIGGGDWAADRLVPDVLKSLSAGEEIVVRNPNAIRPWQHVLEPLAGYMRLAQLLHTEGAAYAEAWNFGPPESGAQTVEWVTTELISHWGGGSWRREGGEHPHEATFLKLDCSKSRDKLSWRPVWAPSEALLHTVSWHKAWTHNQPTQEASLKDIERYTQNHQRLMDVGQSSAAQVEGVVS